MRCISCNKILTEAEDSVKYKESSDRYQLCYGCLDSIEDYWDDDTDNA